jgi:transcriptional regulator with PAS, ATPase and Fis domain
MKKDMTDLKKLVHDIMNGNITDVNNQDVHFNSTFVNHRDAIITSPTAPTVEIINEMPVRDSKQFVSNADEYLDAEVYHDDAVVPTTLEDMEKQMIRKTLEKYRGKRKLAADELKISERTLYRKIKEYGIE